MLSAFDILRHKHPADALLSVDSKSEFLEEHKPPHAPPEEKDTATSGSDSDEMKMLEKENVIQERFRKAHGNVLILSTNTQIRKDMVRSLTGGDILEKKIFNGQISDIYLGTADFKGGHLLNILGVAINKEFGSVLDFFSKSVLGYILLIDAQNISFNYYHYLLQVLHEKTRLPIVIVITRTLKSNTKDTLEVFRKKFSLKETDKIRICEEITPINSKRILFNLIESYYHAARQMERQLRPATMR